MLQKLIYLKKSLQKILYVARDPGDVTRNPGKAWARLRSGMTIFK
jgi:hypothetical protein